MNSYTKTKFKKMVKMKILQSILVGCAIAVNSSSMAFAKPQKEVVLTSEVNWSYINPARKDKSPMAGDLWGNRKEEGATGRVLKE